MEQQAQVSKRQRLQAVDSPKEQTSPQASNKPPAGTRYKPYPDGSGNYMIVKDNFKRAHGSYHLDV